LAASPCFLALQRCCAHRCALKGLRRESGSPVVDVCVVPASRRYRWPLVGGAHIDGGAAGASFVRPDCVAFALPLGRLDLRQPQRARGGDSHFEESNALDGRTLAGRCRPAMLGPGVATRVEQLTQRLDAILASPRWTADVGAALGLRRNRIDPPAVAPRRMVSRGRISSKLC
jgi:hypothetical protein